MTRTARHGQCSGTGSAARGQHRECPPCFPAEKRVGSWSRAGRPASCAQQERTGRQVLAPRCSRALGSENCPRVAPAGHHWPTVCAIGTGGSAMQGIAARNCKGSGASSSKGCKEIQLSTFRWYLHCPLPRACQPGGAAREEKHLQRLQLRDSVHTGPLPHPSPPGRSQGIWERGRGCARTGFNSRQQSLGAVS